MTRTIPTTCTVDGCTGSRQSTGLCSKHYQRKRRTGTLQARHYKKKKPCGVADCTEAAKSRNFCIKHYHRFMRYGDPLFQPPVSSDETCTIPDCEDAAQTKGLCRNHYVNYRYRLSRGDVEDLAGYRAYQAHTRMVARRRNTPAPCSQDDCDNDVVAGGLCSKHYQRRYYQNAPKTNRRSQVCRVHGCIGSVYGNNRCVEHYRDPKDAINQPVSLPVDPARKICAITGCLKLAKQHELCGTHHANYERWKLKQLIRDPFEYMVAKNRQAQKTKE